MHKKHMARGNAEDQGSTAWSMASSSTSVPIVSRFASSSCERFAGVPFGVKNLFPLCLLWLS